MTDLAWSASPRSRRTLADFAVILHNKQGTERIALLVGAGVDLQLTGRGIWRDFVVKVASNSAIPAGEHEALKVVAEAFPVEAAEALRIAVGRTRYYKALKEAAAHQDLTAEGQSMAGLLQQLITKGVRLVVSFNYSRDVAQAISEQGNPQLLIIQRAHLAGWPKLDLLHPDQDKVHLIAIHGIVDETQETLSSAVLDRSSYDSVMYSDLHYSDFLQRIFTDHTVLSVGLSWEDVVLRNAAARVHHAAPLSPKSHAALLPASSTGSSHNAFKADLWKERSFVGAYSVRPLYYDSADHHKELQTVLQVLAQLVEKLEDVGPPTNSGSKRLLNIADLLDLCGDYESVFQRKWFASNWLPLKELLVRSEQDRKDEDHWLALARIERHLRHFLWVYVRPDTRGKAREDCWKAVASAGMELHKTGKLTCWNNGELSRACGRSNSPVGRGLFEFALGAYEVFNDEASSDPTVLYWRNLLDVTVPEKVKARVEIAKLLWKSGSDPADEGTINTLRSSAIECGWESIEAKLSLDLCELKFRSAQRNNNSKPLRELPNEHRLELLNFALDARESARVAGCARRELGAVALASLVEDHERAEADLVGIYHGMVKAVAGGAGPIGTWAIYAGLIATLLDRSTKNPIDAASASKWIQERCGTLRSPEHLDTPAVLRDYWSAFHPEAGELVAQTAQFVAGLET